MQTKSQHQRSISAITFFFFFLKKKTRTWIHIMPPNKHLISGKYHSTPNQKHHWEPSFKCRVLEHQENVLLPWVQTVCSFLQIPWLGIQSFASNYFHFIVPSLEKVEGTSDVCWCLIDLNLATWRCQSPGGSIEARPRSQGEWRQDRGGLCPLSVGLAASYEATFSLKQQATQRQCLLKQLSAVFNSRDNKRFSWKASLFSIHEVRSNRIK